MVPRFSVLIPTYNRADLLGRAIQSVLDQTEKDFELVVSNGGSTDNTKEVVAAFNDDRIRYIEASDKPDMAGNYTLAVQKAIGRHIVFFSDDDALMPRALEKLHSAITKSAAELVVFPFARYYPEGGEEGNRRIPPNGVLIPKYLCELRKIPAKLALQQYFHEYGLSETAPAEFVPVPYIGNYAISAGLLDKIGRDSESLFAQIPIDNYLIAKVLSLIDDYYLLDEPLLVWSRWPNQATAVIDVRGTRLREHYEAQLQGRTLQQSPFTFALPKNLGANALAQARVDLSEPKHAIEPDWKYFVPFIQSHLEYMQDKGMDVNEELEEVRTFTDKYAGLIISVRRIAILRRILRRALPARLKSVISSLLQGHDQMDMVKGEGKFDDFLTCARYLDSETGCG